MQGRNMAVWAISASAIATGLSMLSATGQPTKDAPKVTTPATTQPTSPAATPVPAAIKSLFERLGGIDAIATVVDDFVNRLAVNKTILANKAVADSMAKVSVPGLKFKLTAQLAEATGGPWKYAGKDMKTTHANLNIGDEEWAASVEDLKVALAKFKVPQKEQDELIALLVPLKKDIVTRHTPDVNK